jgi:hypothetical protein
MLLTILNTGMAFWKFKQLSTNTHTCNPSYSAGRTQEDWGSKHCQSNTKKKGCQSVSSGRVPA